MAMKTIKCNMAKAASVFYLGLIASVTLAQEDRGERLQESISSSDQRTDFSARKAAPSKIDSFAFQELLTSRKKCKEAERRFMESQEKYEREKSKATMSSTHASSLKKARAERDAAWTALKAAQATVKAAERKANAD
jgi:hypothetical protein